MKRTQNRVGTYYIRGLTRTIYGLNHWNWLKYKKMDRKYLINS